MDWVEAPQVADPDLEAIRQIAWELTYDNMHFHELAMADPFKAESYVQDIGQRLLELVGYPKGTRMGV